MGIPEGTRHFEATRGPTPVRLTSVAVRRGEGDILGKAVRPEVETVRGRGDHVLIPRRVHRRRALVVATVDGEEQHADRLLVHDSHTDVIGHRKAGSRSGTTGRARILRAFRTAVPVQWL